MELVIIEQMIPEGHLLRRIDRSIDFTFIHKLCEPLYCADNGRPAIDPEMLFRMLFIGYLYGIRSERRLEEEINYNIAYKWFCGLGVTEKAPDATTLSVNRKRRFRDNNISEQIFNEILRQAIQKGLVGGEILYTDSTHVKAKANKNKKVTVEIQRTPKAYLKELDEAIEQERTELGKSRSRKRTTTIRRKAASSKAVAIQKAASSAGKGSQTVFITASTAQWTHQPRRLSRVLERQQSVQGMSKTCAMLRNEYDKKVGDAPCMAG